MLIHLLDCLLVLKKDWTPPFKKPLSLWAKFANEFTKKMPDGTTLKEGLRAASVEWKNLSAEEKAVCWFILFRFRARLLKHLRVMPLCPAIWKNTDASLQHGMKIFQKIPCCWRPSASTRGLTRNCVLSLWTQMPSMCQTVWLVPQRLFFRVSMCRFIKEQFHLVDYPPEATTTAFKLRHLAKTFVSEVTEEEKAVWFLLLLLKTCS